MRATRAYRDLICRLFPPAASRHLWRYLPGSSPYVPGTVESGVIFIHVPKAAGTSLKQELYPNSSRRGHRRIGEYYSWDPDLAGRLHKFAIVRNPWDRLLSAYMFLRQGKRTSRRDKRFSARVLARSPDFTAFVTALEQPVMRRVVLSYDHFRPQRYWICLPGTADHAMDQIARMETLDADIEALYTKLGRPYTPLPHRRRSCHGSYRDAYTVKTREIVQDLYASDVQLLRYRF